MAVLEIVKYPDPVLSTASDRVEAVDDETRQLMEDMLETMYSAPGVGLAAPQVGVNKRIIVIDVRPDDKKDPIMLVNPEIVEGDGKFTYEEGCLSLPEFIVEVERMKEVSVKGINEKGDEVTYKANDLLAVVFQHEIDHLDGILLVDKVSRLKRDIYRRKVKKGLKETARDESKGGAL
ncbi:MAG: peptide deformylase [Deltaproteobacteria bacterium]|uniref:Peptide deformylase n=1 Tax=Candidatus Zymogenus saltonus TaxID=2844893 RepID=A0A9D8KFW8_9DELT|nr:peptide deformylase [Candidatus Zymogenus saltonus]